MFLPHSAQINIPRQNPSNDISDYNIKLMIARKNNLAEKIILKSWMDGCNKKPRHVITKRIVEQNKFDDRRLTQIGFLKCWNKWRKFYFGLDSVKIKTKGQLTQIENGIRLINEYDLKTNFVLACTHKAFEWRKVNPGFHNILEHGIEKYDQLIERVLIDVDTAERDGYQYE